MPSDVLNQFVSNIFGKEFDEKIKFDGAFQGMLTVAVCWRRKIQGRCCWWCTEKKTRRLTRWTGWVRAERIRWDLYRMRENLNIEHPSIACPVLITRPTVRFIWSQVHSWEIRFKYFKPKYQCSRRPRVWQINEKIVSPLALAYNQEKKKYSSSDQVTWTLGHLDREL